MLPDSLLGPVRPYRWGDVATVGSWLVVYHHQKPVDLRPVGQRLWRGLDAPLLGLEVAQLSTEAFAVSLEERHLACADHLGLHRLELVIDCRLDPEEGKSDLLRLMATEGRTFATSLIDQARRRVSKHVRDVLGSHSSHDVARSSLDTLLFADGIPTAGSKALHIVGARVVAEEESVELTRLRQELQRDDVEAKLGGVRHREAERTLTQILYQEQQDLATARAQGRVLAVELEEQTARAQKLGLPPLALAEPELWARLTDAKRELLLALLGSPHHASLIRRHPELLTAALSQVSGKPGDGRLERQGLMILDSAAPHLALTAPDAKVAPMTTARKLLDRPGLRVDDTIQEVWRSQGGMPLSGAAFAVCEHRAAVMVCVPGGKPSVPVGFPGAIAKMLGGDVSKADCRVRAWRASTPREVIECVLTHLAQPDVHWDLNVRLLGDVIEVLVTLHGSPPGVRDLHHQLSNPLNPTTPCLEGLLQRARVRVGVA